VIILAVLTLIWVGLQFILARGDVAKMKELKEWLLWIVVGIAVVISARLIVDIVINTLSATGTIDANTLNTIKSAK
jgi:preprotein translocase subunit YajC